MSKAVKERGIIFPGPQVRAVLDGRKTQHRSPVGGCTVRRRGMLAGLVGPDTDQIRFDTESGEWYCEGGLWHKRCPWGKKSDHLWGKETWAVDAPLDQVRREREDVLQGIGHGPYYRADKVHEGTGLIWRPPLHMPRDLSRITLEIESIRVERLQDITEEDAEAEGATAWAAAYCSRAPEDELYAWAYYELMWKHGYGKKYPWESNPWVWCITFKRVQL